MSNLYYDIEKKVDAFILSLPCRVQRPYPSAVMPFKDLRAAQLLLDAFANGGNAELTAVSQYINHHLTIENKEVAKMLFCISLVEMKHLDMIGTMIESLGGDPKYWRTNKFYWTGGNVAYGDTLCEKIALDAFAEEEAIVGYETLLKLIDINPVREVIERIIEDENFHLAFFEDAFQRFCGQPFKKPSGGILFSREDKD